jgi:uncharacterized iron-regulated membrane protein
MAALPSPWGPRRVVWTIHRWLGLASGAVVFVVALTGALYAFAPEIRSASSATATRMPASGCGP